MGLTGWRSGGLAQTSQNRRRDLDLQDARRRLEVSVYLDANILVSPICPDAHTRRADAALRGVPEVLISDFGGAEFASAISKRLRMREIGLAEAKGHAIGIRPMGRDLCDLPLRTPDALQLFGARR